MVQTPSNIKLYIEKDYDAMSKRAAELLAEDIRRRPNGIFGFATGSTPIGMYKCLIELYKNGALDFSGITAVNLDEYHPISRTNEQSYSYFMRDKLFNHVNIKNICPPSGETDDPEQECRRYDNLLEGLGYADTQILGIGLNGHIGFNEPSDCFTKGTHHVALHESTIQANLSNFGSIEEMPKTAITMGIRSIMLAKKILLLANGAKKADILFESLFGDIRPQVPASVLQLHRDVVIVVDEEAGRRFKG